MAGAMNQGPNRGQVREGVFEQTLFSSERGEEWERWSAPETRKNQVGPGDEGDSKRPGSGERGRAAGWAQSTASSWGFYFSSSKQWQPEVFSAWQ